MMVRCRVVLTALVLLLALPGVASAAQLIDRDATGVKIAVNAKGQALITYQQVRRHRPPRPRLGRDQRDPSAGGRSTRRSSSSTTPAAGAPTTRCTGRSSARRCGRYDGPVLAERRRRLQGARRLVLGRAELAAAAPDLGFTPWLPEMNAQWLEVSHWTGDVAQLETGSNWVYGGRFQAIFGRLTYNDQPVYGFGTTRFGAPTDGFGSLIYLDTFNSVYGPGWRRENSFVTHNPTGVFCYGFYPFDPTKGGYKHPPGQTAKRGPGTGEKYRLTASGPGVTPNVAAIIDGSHPYDRSSAADVAWQQQQSSVLLAGTTGSAARACPSRPRGARPRRFGRRGDGPRRDRDADPDRARRLDGRRLRAARRAGRRRAGLRRRDGESRGAQCGAREVGPAQLVQTQHARRRSSGAAPTDLTDPRIAYDALSGRWFSSISDIDASSVLLAVSAERRPDGAAGRSRRTRQPGCADQPRLGLDRRDRRPRRRHLSQLHRERDPAGRLRALDREQAGAARRLDQVRTSRRTAPTRTFRASHPSSRSRRPRRTMRCRWTSRLRASSISSRSTASRRPR